ncbi:MAG: hypothetical protein ACON5G_04070, partial [Pirellulaceae bacterium]
MSSETIQTLQWVGDHTGHLTLIDQTLLPTELITIDCSSVEAVWEAIKVLRVRGAPAIGVAAAYGVCVGIQTLDLTFCSPSDFTQRLTEVTEYLASSFNDE